MEENWMGSISKCSKDQKTRNTLPEIKEKLKMLKEILSKNLSKNKINELLKLKSRVLKGE